ncbi:UxaA family hydrolase [Salipiger sp. PrR002]|uniref:UxaA family hydrolase n=1 Tax=Salipiger sp. PrR002 TaxID=2706489 RepID=UPI0013BAC0BC|nr:UxaA family hydrolase [Salipiger sp. PrR002]NDW01806.1 UxaA family hydrolase [Salipiger sp. PrR002]NDW58940.1 UxaA family hydrolase [Salipiger sp. PrR004]
MTKSGSTMFGAFLLLSPADNVLVARAAVEEGSAVPLEGGEITLSRPIPLAHKIARHDIAEGARILKYGMPIGIATEAIPAGAHVHVHNIRSAYTPTHMLQDADGLSAGVAQ